MKKVFLLAAAAMLVMSCLLVGCGKDYAKQLQDSNSFGHTMTVGDAFNKYFESPHWETTGSDDDVYVEFTGKGAYDESAVMKGFIPGADNSGGDTSLKDVKFVFDYSSIRDSFELDSCTVDGEELTGNMPNLYIESIYNAVK